MTTAMIDARALPRPIRRGLGRIDRRIRSLALVRGLGVVALALAVVACLGMAADFFFTLPDAARWAIWGGWIGAGSLALLAAVVAPLLRRRDWVDLAAVAEAGNPSLGERLAGAVDLLGRQGRSHGSPAMIAALAEDASARAGALDLGRAVSPRSAAAWLALGLVASAGVIAPAFVRPDPFATLGRRFLSPWLAIERAGRFLVEVAPGDAVVAIGSDVKFVATVRPRFGEIPPADTAWLEWADDDGTKHRTKMAADESAARSSRTYRATLPRVAGPIGYRVATDSAAGRRHRITAVAPPAVAKVSARIQPPAYTKAAPSIAKDAGRIEAWEGSAITLTVAANKPLTAARVEWPSATGEESADGRPGPPPIAMTSADGGATWTAIVEAEVSGHYVFKLEDEHHLANRPEPSRRLVVRPDAPPTVALAGSGEPRDAQPDDLLAVDASARDDLAVMTAELAYSIDRAGRNGPDTGSAPVRFDGLGTRTAQGDAALGLKSLDLGPGDVLTYRLKVADSRPKPRGPNVTTSAPRILRIVDKAEPLLARDRSAERESLQAQLTALKKLAAENRLGAESLRYAADAAQRGNGAWDAIRQDDLARREGSARDVVEKLQILARDFAESDQFASLARPARQIAEVEAEGGRETLDRARKADEPAKRLAELRQADDRLAAVQKRLDELQAKFDELAKLDDDRRSLRQLAEKEEALAARADDAAKDGDRDATEKLRQEQEALRGQLDELTRRSPELKAEALAAKAKQADDLARRARELAEKQREEARRTADPDARAAKLKGLAEEQRKLEDDARRLALRIDRPLGENGRNPVDSASLARPIEPIEKGEIEQGRQRLDEAEDSLRRLARELEDIPDDPKALARRLARRQEALNEHTNEVLREAQQPEQKAALPEKLKPLAARQEAIARLAAALPALDPAKDQAKEATKATARAAEALKSPAVDQVPQRQNEARDALNRLAEALPDTNQRRWQVREAVNEARSRTDQVAREVENLLRETARKPDPNFNPEAAARDLANRIAPLADRQAEAVRHLADMAPDPRALPQQERALKRARDFADALDALRESAPPEAKKAEAQAAADWRILGPLEGVKARPPFAVDRPIDFKAAYDGPKGTHPTWKPARSGDRGKIDLAALVTRDNNRTAFGAAEIQSPARGKGRLIIGSDDNCTVWLNGKKVFEFDGSRSWNPIQDHANVEFAEGPNSLLVKCGNGDSEWAFSVAAETPRPSEMARVLDRVEQLRNALPAAKNDAVAAIERLDEKLQSHEPADDRAAEIAAEMKAPAPGADPARALQDAAAALRNLKAPDAPAEQAEAVRLAERAAAATAQARPEAAEARRQAAEAATDLARRLADELSPREQVAALARAQKGLTQPDTTPDRLAISKAQESIAARIAALPIPGPAKAAAAQATHRAAEMAEQQVYLPDLAAKPERMAVRAEAAKAVEALATADIPAPPKAQPPADGAVPRARAEALATRQFDLAREAGEVAKKAEAAKDDQAAQAKAAADLAALAGRQQALAEAARALPDTLPPRSGERREAEKQRDEARSAQARASAAMTNHDPKRAAEMANQAAEATARLARALPDKNPDPAQAQAALPHDPEAGLDAEHTAAARDLARRERKIKEQLQAVLGERIAPQEKLREETAALGRALAELRDASRDLSPRAAAPANAAAELLQNHAPPTMGQANEQLASGRPDQARDLQRVAAAVVQQATHQAEDVATALRADAEAAGQAHGQGEDQGLAAARDAQLDASRQLAEARDAQAGPAAGASRASAAMRQAAQGLRSASKSGRGKPGRQKGEPDPNDPDPQGESGRADPHLAELKETIKARAGRNWGELPGHLRTEILQMSQAGYRDDYARLIGLYFREIAAGKDETTPGKKP